MTDRELLELAAKAVGRVGYRWCGRCFLAKWNDSDGGWFELGSVWDPLNSDGDALRLAVKLRLRINREINCGCDIVEVFGPEADDMSCHCTTESVENDDPYAATRRAIVRAAAEIGRNMK